MLEFLREDLSPGDLRSADFDWTGYTVSEISSPDDPLLRPAYEFLWAEFGDKNEMEQLDVLVERLGWRADRPVNDCGMKYRMIVVRKDRAIAGVRDCTAIVPLDYLPPLAVVHLSHVLIAPEFRGTGISAWMRSWPVQVARDVLQECGRSIDAAVNLVAEMEHPTPGDMARHRRLAAYEKAGFLKADPNAVPYHQPDFRPFAQIDAAGGAEPIPFALVMRRVRRETEPYIPGDELRATVAALYRMYSTTMRPQDMAPLWTQLREAYPRDEARVALVPPTKT